MWVGPSQEPLASWLEKLVAERERLDLVLERCEREIDGMGVFEYVSDYPGFFSRLQQRSQALRAIRDHKRLVAGVRRAVGPPADPGLPAKAVPHKGGLIGVQFTEGELIRVFLSLVDLEADGTAPIRCMIRWREIDPDEERARDLINNAVRWWGNATPSVAQQPGEDSFWLVEAPGYLGDLPDLWNS